MKPAQVCGIGHALVDIGIEVSEAEVAGLGMERGSSLLMTPEAQRRLLEEFRSRIRSRSGGGSVANSLVAFAQLGGRAALICATADDEYGDFFRKDLQILGITTTAPVSNRGDTGTCVALITPDAERTMRTSLGVAATLSSREIGTQQIESAQWLFIEGYVLATPNGREAVERAIDCARAAGTKIALTVSDESIVRAFREELATLLPKCTLIFANAREAAALTGEAALSSAFNKLKSAVPYVAVTLGAKGVLVAGDGEETLVPAFPCKPVDATGAGDMFAGVFLYCLAHGYSVREAARRGCFLAARVISDYGARIKGDLRAIFDSIPQPPSASLSALGNRSSGESRDAAAS